MPPPPPPGPSSAHPRLVRPPRPARLVRRRSRPGRPLHVRRHRPACRSVEEPRHRRDRRSARAPRRADGRRRALRGDAGGRAHQHDRRPCRAAHRPAAPGRGIPPRARRRRARRRCRRAVGARVAVGLRRTRAKRRVDGRDRQEGHPHRQHRHRRLRPRPRHDLGCARAVLDRRHRGALRVEHRPVRPREHDQGTRPRDDPLHRRVEDVHDARDPHECPVGARLAVARARGIRSHRRRFDGGAQRPAVEDRRRRHHFVAVSTALDKVAEFGIDP